MEARATELALRIIRKDAERHTVSGWAYVSKDTNGTVVVDHSGDVIDIHDLKKAMQDFMRDVQASGEMHKGAAENVAVELYTFTPEDIEALQKSGALAGSIQQGALCTIEVGPETFAKIRDGALLAFSIEGQAEEKAVA